MRFTRSRATTCANKRSQSPVSAIPRTVSRWGSPLARVLSRFRCGNGTVSMSGPRILVVDDEVPLLSLLQRYLGRLGYEVDTAATAETALDHFAAGPERYACVLTDLTLP